MLETDGFTGTSVEPLLGELNRIYAEIASAQSDWIAANPFGCPDGCGQCCVAFEPDVLESEALYLAAWLVYHRPSVADSILDGSFTPPRVGSALPESGCLFFDPASAYHCTVYDGRALICRLFGYAGDRGKDGAPRWKPCKFLPFGERFSEVASVDRQYDEEELRAIFGVMPPVMSDFAARVLALTPDGAEDRASLRDALPSAIAKIRMLQRFSRLPPEPDSPEPNPNAPLPRAS